MLRKHFWRITILIFLFCGLFSSSALAHAVLLKAVPTQGSDLKKSPPMILLSFNERLEKELFYIRVYNQLGKQVTSEQAAMSEDQHEIRLSLPPLEDGIYTVTYHVISTDGHPVEEAYTLTVGNASEKSGFNDSTLEGSHHGSASTFIIRILYYLSMLALAGWVLWGGFYPISSQGVRDGYRYWLQNFRHFFLIMLVGSGLVEVTGLLSGMSVNHLVPLLTRTSFGIAWVGSLFLSIISYFVLSRFRGLDIIWVVLVLGFEGINGHAITFNPPVLTVSLDLLHLIVASLWVGGILYISLLSRRDINHVKGFLPGFSRIALLSIILLVVTGIFITYFFIPKLNLLFVTTWDVLLTVKVVLVLLVMVVASLIRRKMKKGDVERVKNWFSFDLTFMILIVGIVGVLTYVSPLPENKPLVWDESWDGVQMRSQITPNVPGENRFQVDLYAPQEGVTVKQIQLFMKNKDQGIAPIQVPLKLQKETGAGEYSYIGVGPYLPFAGNWTMQIRILDSNDDETVHTKDFTIYEGAVKQ